MGLNQDGIYSKHVWHTGDRITAKKMNQIEDSLYDINDNANTKYVDLSNNTNEKFEDVKTELETIQNDVNTKATMATVVSNLYNTEGIINQILDVCQSYTDNFDKFVYGNIYTAWDDIVQTVDGKYQLDCSSFQSLLLHGVSFYNSRYNGHADNYGSPLFFQNINSYEYRLANQIAKYCVENGYAFLPNEDLSNIRAGDLVFFSWNSFDTDPDSHTQAERDFHNKAFMKIDHIAMYLDRKNETYHKTIQYEQYTPQFLYEVGNEYMNQCVLVARLPFANVNDRDTKNLVVNGKVKQTCSNNIVIGTYYLNKKLEKGKMYTLVINGQITSADCYFVAQDLNGNTIMSDYGRTSLSNGTMAHYFLYQGEGVDAIKIFIGSSNTSNTSRNGYVNWCVLNEGYKLISKDYHPNSIYNIRSIELQNHITSIFLDGYAYTNTFMETDTHYIVNLNVSVSTDFVSNTNVIGYLGVNITNTQRIPCLLISHDNVSTMGAIQFRWNGEISIIKYDGNATYRHILASGVVVK